MPINPPLATQMPPVPRYEPRPIVKNEPTLQQRPDPEPFREQMRETIQEPVREPVRDPEPQPPKEDEKKVFQVKTLYS